MKAAVPEYKTVKNTLWEVPKNYNAQFNRLRKNTRKILFLSVHYDKKLHAVLIDVECFSFYFIIQRKDEYVPQRNAASFTV